MDFKFYNCLLVKKILINKTRIFANNIINSMSVDILFVVLIEICSLALTLEVNNWKISGKCATVSNSECCWVIQKRKDFVCVIYALKLFSNWIDY